MRRSPALVLALALARPLAAQVTDSSPFRRLELPTPGIYRSAGGMPGPGYWQNRADYDLAGALDTATHTISGTGTIRYTNHSPDTLAFVWLQMDQDIQAANSINRSAPPPPLLFAGVPFYMAVEGPAGGFTVDSFTTDRGPVKLYHWDTMLRVDLTRPLAPGETMTIRMAWSFPVPVNGVARMGRDGALYEIAQWYPRMAVYDDVNGWNTLPYNGPGEFYLEYGDYDARLTVPAGYIVASSGELMNPDEVLTAEQRARLARARSSDDPVAIITAEEAGNAARTRPSTTGMATWHFTAHNVRDLAWAAAPNFRWDASCWDTLGQSHLIQTYYRPGAQNWEEGNRMARHAIASHSRWFVYPYPQASAVEGPIDGMEYPMIVFVPEDPARTHLAWVMMHELGHQWFPMTVGSDERRYPWMDEGFNTFIDLYTVSDYLRGSDPVNADSVLNGPLGAYAGEAVPGREQPLITPPSEIKSLYWVAYQKPALLMRLLRENVLGHEAFDAALRAYASRWAFKHPQPADFFRTMANVSGRNLDWYWREWIFTTSRLDQSVDSVVIRRDSARIVLGNKREMVMPVKVRLTWSDGTAETRDIPVDAWNYGRHHAFTVALGGKRLVSVEVDPDREFPDVDRGNNRWPRGVPRHTP